MSRTWRCKKCSRSVLRLIDLPGHLPTGKAVSRAALRKDIRQVLSSYGGWGWGGGVLQIPPGHPVLGLSVVCKVTRRQFRTAIGEADSLEEPVLVGLYLPHHLDSIGLRRMNPKRAAWLAIHAHHLVHIGVEAHAVKQLIQGFKCPLKAGCPH